MERIGVNFLIDLHIKKVCRMKSGIELITQERKSQIEAFGFDVEHDQGANSNGELLDAAAYVITSREEFYPGGWDYWFKNKLEDKKTRMSEKEYTIEKLAIAGALIAAEIDRINSL